MKREPLNTVSLTAEEYKTLFNHDINARFIDPSSQLMGYGTASRQRDHWRKLHTTLFTPEEFELWIQGIPGCSSCQRDFRRILKTLPPRYDDWNHWTWEVHNTVNKKLGKPEITWEDARILWGWE